MVFKTTDMGMVCVFQMVFIEMKLMYKCFYLKINNDKKKADLKEKLQLKSLNIQTNNYYQTRWFTW